jgi:hypothetical protein
MTNEEKSTQTSAKFAGPLEIGRTFAQLPSISYGEKPFFRSRAMKINPFSVPNPPVPSQIQATGATKDADDLAGLNGFGGGGGYSPSFELQNLLQQSQQQPDVRPDVVSAALQRYQQGFYLTPSSAEQTAAAIIGDASNS